MLQLLNRPMCGSRIGCCKSSSFIVGVLSLIDVTSTSEEHLLEDRLINSEAGAIALFCSDIKKVEKKQRNKDVQFFLKHLILEIKETIEKKISAQ